MVHQHGDEHDIPHHHRVHRQVFPIPGGWLPADHRLHRDWLSKQIKHVDGHGDQKPKLIPVLQEFKDFIEGNPRIYMYFSQMWEEVPHKHPYDKDPTGAAQIRDYEHMLDMLNHVFTKAPEWTDAAYGVGMVGVPMVGIFDYAMATPSGHAAFLDPDVNRMLKKVLNEWGKFLQTPASAEVLNAESGWFGKARHGGPDVRRQRAPEDVAHSWDDFFTRQLREGVRPVASPEDDSVVANACESKVYNVARREAAGPVLDQGPAVLGGGHAGARPAVGAVRRVHRVPGVPVGAVDGTYFSEPILEKDGGQEYEIDSRGISMAQGYLTALATRAVIFIEADNPDIGLMAFIGIGMDEVSTCDITVKEGQHIKKGEQTGMFHFGGSSHCLLFRKGVKIDGFPDVGRDENVPVRSKVAVVSK
ncbi:uncharacterized protein PG998_005280 [Apiospora kogelbergensis]|uniref:uncharacterized protein n=1 Tax=Apiospora kogelbergensis TaxID=1337665 RepID=UPI0031322B82